MKNLKVLLICFSVFAFMSCSNDEDVNRAPRAFMVTLTDVSSRTATPVRYLEVTWTEAVDSDRDDVTYKVYVDDVFEEEVLVGDDREVTVSYEATGDDVIVKVVAEDENGAKTTAQATKVVNVIHP